MIVLSYVFVRLAANCRDNQKLLIEKSLKKCSDISMLNVMRTISFNLTPFFVCSRFVSLQAFEWPNIFSPSLKTSVKIEFTQWTLWIWRCINWQSLKCFRMNNVIECLLQYFDIALVCSRRIIAWYCIWHIISVTIYQNEISYTHSTQLFNKQIFHIRFCH